MVLRHLVAAAEPKDKYGDTRYDIRDPDGYIIEVGQSKPDFTYG